MGDIQVLSDNIINKIAAGEVVQRPASVIKELLENSIDAGATRVSVVIEKAGSQLIRISDNGSGMDREDAKLAIERHATSKVKTSEDLVGIGTLGFRGEALASIAAVSKLILRTKQRDAEVGTKIVVEGGRVQSIDEIGCPAGTTIEVRDLFFNTPARKKFLKAESTEMSHITDVVTRYALGLPLLHLSLQHNEKDVIEAPSSSSVRDAIAWVYGTDTAKHMIDVDNVSEEITVTGMISKPTLSRPDRTQQTAFLNTRYIRSKIITDAINDAYNSVAQTDRFSVCVIRLTLAPTSVDVNVHPEKTEVRFSQEQKIYQAVYNAIRTTLLNADLVPDVETNNVKVETQETIVSTQQTVATTESTQFSEPKASPSIARDTEPEIYTKEEQTSFTSEVSEGNQVEEESAQKSSENPLETITDPTMRLPAFTYLASLNDTYILGQTEEGLVVIDQHIVQERALYEQFRDELRSNAIKKQTLIAPITIELSLPLVSVYEEHKDHLSQLGFENESFGQQSVIVRTVPSVLGRVKDTSSIKDTFLEILQEPFKQNDIEKEFEERVIRMACRKSIKAGDTLHLNELKKMLEVLFKSENPFTCPHGRPIYIKVSYDEIEKLFKRRQ